MTAHKIPTYAEWLNRFAMRYRLYARQEFSTMLKGTYQFTWVPKSFISVHATRLYRARKRVPPLVKTAVKNGLSLKQNH